MPILQATDPRRAIKPVNRMIADLQLTGERHGGLLFAFQANLMSRTRMGRAHF